jgi:hypothetical protein
MFFAGGPKWLTSILGVDVFCAITSFGFSPPGNTFTWEREEAGKLIFKYEFKTGLTDADMPALNKLHYLQLLQLEANGNTDNGLSQLSDLPYVETLSLGNTAVTDKGLSALSNFPRLRKLELRGTDISDAGIAAIGKCEKLEDLDLAMTNVTRDGVRSLQQTLPNCKINYFLQ